MENVKDNLFINRMEGYMNLALFGNGIYKPCASEIRSIVIDFFKSTMRIDIDWDNGGIRWQIERVSEIVKYIAQNTRDYYKMASNEVEVVRELVKEIYLLRDEALRIDAMNDLHKESNSDIDFGHKIACIGEIIRKNMTGMHDEAKSKDYKDGMIFQNLENLLKLVHRLNTEWDDLCNRGFSLNVINDFIQAVEYDRKRGHELDEEEKYDIFNNILDGNMKFVPVFRLVPECYVPVANDYFNYVFYDSEAFNEKPIKNPYRLRQKGEGTDNMYVPLEIKS
mgnify:CR=1 FL=1